ncbi:MAG: hypothetical protein HRT44_05945 [Bdellovibrionales bacterium]|nr:hypothetical protein [Bdellovibrionales bacterium]NQZ18784.1 hypothetical protein [Bdellovibrionales bacterium]
MAAKKNQKESILLNAYNLKEMFEDSYEHEVYFELVNSISVLDLCPSDIEIEFSLKVKQPRLSFPDSEPKLVRVIVPLAKSQNNPRKKSELRVRYFHQYGELVPKMRLSIKNQLAALRKDLVSPAEQRIIDREVKRLRASGLRKTKAKLSQGVTRKKKTIRKKTTKKK